jgi:hypothetical protein
MESHTIVIPYQKYTARMLSLERRTAPVGFQDWPSKHKDMNQADLRSFLDSTIALPASNNAAS